MNGSLSPAERAEMLDGMDSCVVTVASQIFEGKIGWDKIVELHQDAPLPRSGNWARFLCEEHLAQVLRDHLTEQFGQEATFQSEAVATLINYLIDRGYSAWPPELQKLADQAKTPA